MLTPYQPHDDNYPRNTPNSRQTQFTRTTDNKPHLRYDIKHDQYVTCKPQKHIPSNKLPQPNNKLIFSQRPIHQRRRQRPFVLRETMQTPYIYYTTTLPWAYTHTNKCQEGSKASVDDGDEDYDDDVDDVYGDDNNKHCHRYTPTLVHVKKAQEQMSMMVMKIVMMMLMLFMIMMMMII